MIAVNLWRVYLTTLPFYFAFFAWIVFLGQPRSHSPAQPWAWVAVAVLTPFWPLLFVLGAGRAAWRWWRE